MLEKLDPDGVDGGAEATAFVFAVASGFFQSGGEGFGAVEGERESSLALVDDFDVFGVRAVHEEFLFFHFVLVE